MLPKTVSFILHLYQPSIQSSAVVKQIYESSYSPLLKILKNNKNAHVTLNMPLSFLEILDAYGYGEWISDVAKLYELGKIEITGSAAYHALLSQFDSRVIEDEIVINEYGLGYYFGKKTGFEGEKSILIKDIHGFFPPELAVNDNVLDCLGNLGYQWVLVDSCAIGAASTLGTVLEYKQGLKVLLRDTQLSNAIAFHRGFDIYNFVTSLKSSNDSHIFIALDGETFGHHNKDGILYFDSLLDSLTKEGIEVTTPSSFVNSLKSLKGINEIKDSSWGATSNEVTLGNTLPFWKNSTNEAQSIVWEIMLHIQDQYLNLRTPAKDTHNLENVALWKNDTAVSLEDPELQKYLMLQFSYLRSLMSDALWWLSGGQLYNGENVYDTTFAKKYVEMLQAMSVLASDSALDDLISKLNSSLKF